MSAKTPFRVIVVGGGIGGLAASHCLQKAGIDHVVLEKYSNIAPPEGSSIGLYANSLRILGQCGSLKALEAAGTQAKYFWMRSPDGKLIKQSYLYQHVLENHGHSLIMFERGQLLQVLYDTLPDKTPIRTGCCVADVKESPDGVEVVMKDGSIEKGDIVIGCDGVHSRLRSIMWEHANQMTPGLITEKEKNTYVTGWRALIGITPDVPALGKEDVTLVYEKGYSFLFLADPKRVFFFVFFKLDEPFSGSKREYYTNDDANALAETLADHPINESVKFGDIWRNRSRGSLISLQEGVLEHWHNGRIALAGDSIHKVTPNIGLGGNLAMESVAILCNCINEMLTAQNGAKPSQAAITEAFSKYQSLQKDRAKDTTNRSGLNTRLQAWVTPFYKFMATWIQPLVSDRFIANRMGELFRTGPKLDYADFEEEKNARLPWKERKLSNEASWPLKVRSTLRVALSAAAMAWVAISLGVLKIVD